MRVGAVEVFASVKIIGQEAYAYASGDEERSIAVGAAAAGEVGGFGGYADVYGDGRVEAED